MISRSMPRLAALLACLVLWAACAGRPAPGPALIAGALPDPDFVLFAPCNRTQAEAFAALQQADAGAALRAASCYVQLADSAQEERARSPMSLEIDFEDEDEGPSPLEDAKAARAAAEIAVRSYPDSGVAHYLLAFAIGLNARLNPIMGLDLVPAMEQEALLAARLDPGVDDGGPDRMLGKLYLRAPDPPVSVGSLEKSLERFRAAVRIAPDHAANRIGLARALLADEEAAVACDELAGALKRMSFGGDPEDLEKALDVLDDICEGIR